MHFSKLLAAGFVVLLAAGGAAAAGAGIGPIATPTDTSSVTNADVYASSENETVILTLVDDADGDGVANATVEVTREYEHDGRDADDEDESARVGRTDANGAVTVSLDPENESRTVTALDVEFAKGAFDAELEYRVENDSLTLLEETYEYEQADEEHDDDGTQAQYDDSERMSVGTADARAIAAAALEEPPEGDWALVEADAHEADNYYEFEYVLRGADRPGEAEIRVHGSDGEVIEYEQEIEQTDEAADAAHEDERQRDEAESEQEADEREDDGREDDEQEENEQEENEQEDEEREDDEQEENEQEENEQEDEEREDDEQEENKQEDEEREDDEQEDD